MDCKYGNLPERMEKSNLMDELNVLTSATVQTASTFVKLVSSAEFVDEIAQIVADAWKNVFSVHVISLHEGVEGVLEKEKRILVKWWIILKTFIASLYHKF